MTKETGVDELFQLVADVLGVDASSLTEQSSPENVVQWDSLNHLMLVTAIESEFGVGVGVDDAIAMRSIALIRSFLRSRIGEDSRDSK